MSDPDGHLERCKTNEDPISLGLVQAYIWHIPPFLLLGSLYLLAIGLCVLVYDHIGTLFGTPHFGPFVSQPLP